MLKPQLADLHVHTHYSDGTWTPEDLVREARAARVAIVAVTDHDTVDGVAPAQEAADGSGVRIVPGVELSCHYRDAEVHILGFFVDPGDAAMAERMASIRDWRIQRIFDMVERLKALGYTR